jgi:succinoglycan biosynthesis transport protein ExoP
MADSIPQIEVLQGPHPDPVPRERAGANRQRRLVTFLLGFVLCSTLGLYYVLQRPAVYRASASLLTVAQPDVDQPGIESDVQHVAVQRQLLLGQPLLEEVLRRLEQAANPADAAGGLGIDQLMPMLEVVPVPETNLVELRAEGPDPALLPRLVNTWIDVYVEMRDRAIRQATGATTEALRQQYEALGEKIAQKREQLERFRSDNEILSMGRDENQVLARLKGLSDSLNTASEEEVKAKARLDAIKAAIDRGEAVVPEQDERSLAQMEQRAQELREQLADLDERYTREFLALKPELRVIPEQLAELEAKIDRKLVYGRSFVLTQAEQDYAAAHQTAQELAQQLEAHKQRAAEFTARFAEHEALQEDLVSIEELYRTTEGRLVQIDVANRDKYPQVEVVERAYRPSKPVRPLYLRDAAMAVGGSILVGLFLVWLVEFLSPREGTEGTRTLFGLRVLPTGMTPSIAGKALLDKLNAPTAALLEDTSPRELSESEVAAMLEVTDTASRQLIAVLLSGVSPAEAVLLESNDFDPMKDRLRIRGDSPRELQLPATVVAILEGPEPFPAWREAEIPAASDLDARLQLAAVDAGLKRVEQIDTHALRHTYVAYLVRQGVKLSALEPVVGKMSPEVLAAYGPLSPTRPGCALDDISLVYPVFAERR